MTVNRLLPLSQVSHKLPICIAKTKTHSGRTGSTGKCCINIAFYPSHFRWLGMVMVVPPLLFLLFEMIRGSAKNEKTRNGFLIIWHTTLWSIWKARNNAIFGNGSFIPQLIVDDIKVLS
ncbi:hypothetical protein TSUD_314270 [Trifolium subterraneum]|uniref:Uncharacterized protein n=1 Tax=Trifolium subterraneum TaxID=3900 RepID=A0A2Z6MTN6_TRISU|nr:hypothetical protein TSUD_314270 [Trifolium subterraneum]